MKNFCLPSTDLAKYQSKIFFFAVGSGVSSREWGRLTGSKINLNGTKHPIITLGCGDDPIEKLKVLTQIG